MESMNDGGKVKLLQVTRGEALGLQIVDAMTRRTLEALQLGGYRPSRAELLGLSRGAVALSLALANLIVDATDGGAPVPSDAEIDDWVEGMAYAGVVEALGPPSTASLN